MDEATKSAIRMLMATLEQHESEDEIIKDLKWDRMQLIQSVLSPDEAFKLKLQCDAIDALFHRLREIAQESPIKVSV